MTDKKIIIAVDGPAASGKGTIAKRLARELNLAHMDTGALYRLVGAIVICDRNDPEDEAAAIAAAQKLQQTYRTEMSDNPDIRTAAAGQAASQVAQFQGVRDALYDLQVNFAHHPPADKDGTVLDGRDVGTVICPDADVKLFITASPEERARRRTIELQAKDPAIQYEDILADMIRRDRRDTERAIVPLKPADDAVIIDTSEMDVDEVFEKANQAIFARR